MKLFCKSLLLILVFISCKKKNNNEVFIPSGALLTLDTLHVISGEDIYLTGKLGVLNAAKIHLDIDANYHTINQKVCYKTQLTGELSGTVDLFSNLVDTFTSYVDTSSLKPVYFVRNLKENKYKLKEYSYFNFDKKMVEVHQLNTKRADSVRQHAISEHTQDLISSFHYLRRIDFSKYKLTDTLSIDLDIEENLQNLKFVQLGSEIISTKIGKLKAIVLQPIVPENEMFIGKNPVKVWISDDARRIPLKIKAKTWVGNVTVEIDKYTQKR